MLSEELKSVQAALGVLAGRVSEDDWNLISLARQNLVALAEVAESMENHLAPSPLEVL